jgi:hypothetical protein
MKMQSLETAKEKAEWAAEFKKEHFTLCPTSSVNEDRGGMGWRSIGDLKAYTSFGGQRRADWIADAVCKAISQLSGSIREMAIKNMKDEVAKAQLRARADLVDATGVEFHAYGTK